MISGCIVGGENGCSGEKIRGAGVIIQGQRAGGCERLENGSCSVFVSI